MPVAARWLHGWQSFSSPEYLEGIEIRCVPRHASLKFGLQFVGTVHPQIGIVNQEAMIGSKRNRAVDRFDALLKQRIVVVHAPPTLTVVGVCDVELRSRVSVCRVCAFEGEARFVEGVSLEEPKAIGDRLGVYLIGPDGGR